MPVLRVDPGVAPDKKSGIDVKMVQYGKNIKINWRF